MVRFVKLSDRWINLDHVASVDEVENGLRINADLAQGTGRISRGVSGEDATTLRAALSNLTVNVVTSADIVTPITEELEDRG